MDFKSAAERNVYWHLARVRQTTVEDAKQRFPTLEDVRVAYGNVLVKMWMSTPASAQGERFAL